MRETTFGELFPGALQENPVIAPGQLYKKMFIELFWGNHFAVEGIFLENLISVR